jgi:Zn-dependent protease
MIERAKAPREETPSPSQFDYKVTYAPSRAKFGFSATEIRDLIISTVLVSGVGLSMLGFGVLNIDPIFVVALLILFTSAFLMHEIAHKITAQHFGLWAEFRLTMIGALITLLSIISPFFKIISPGAVMISGTASKETIGKTSIAGPLTNIVFCMIALALVYVLPPSSSLVDVAVLTAFFNAFIAILNLIPIGILDGWKVFQWNKVIWGLAFASSIILIFALLQQRPELLSF